MTVTVTKQAGARTDGSGSWVLRITASDSPDDYPGIAYAQHSYVLEAGVEYRIKGWLRCDPTNAFDPIIWTSRVDEGGDDTAIVGPGPTTPWYEFDEIFTPTHDSRLRFGGANGGAPTGDFWWEFDDITLWATADEPTNPILYWTAGNDAVLDKDLVTVYEGEQSLSVTGQVGGDFAAQDVNLDERYAVDAFVMHDSGDGVIRSRTLTDPGGGPA
jgi:hypothetical protein